MKFSVMFWGDAEASNQAQKYRLLLQVARYADEHDYTAIWTPERHFHAFGGCYPNPSVISAALAVATTRLTIRAGSVVVPLHHPLRIVEEWSVVDNLSGGRVAIGAASGWKPDDFILCPQPAAAYASRRPDMWRALEQIEAIWTGASWHGDNGLGHRIAVTALPRPLQRRLPIWITAAGSPTTFVEAGRRGYNVLTHLLGQDVQTLGGHIRAYRMAGREAGRDLSTSAVTVMLHTYLGRDVTEVRARVRAPFIEYLRQSADLAVPAEERHRIASTPRAVIDEMLEIACERYFGSASLMGTIDSCAPLIAALHDIGVDEICCLVDLALEDREVMNSLDVLTELKQRCHPRTSAVS